MTTAIAGPPGTTATPRNRPAPGKSSGVQFTPLSPDRQILSSAPISTVRSPEPSRASATPYRSLVPANPSTVQLTPPSTERAAAPPSPTTTTKLPSLAIPVRSSVRLTVREEKLAPPSVDLSTVPLLPTAITIRSERKVTALRSSLPEIAEADQVAPPVVE